MINHQIRYHQPTSAQYYQQNNHQQKIGQFTYSTYDILGKGSFGTVYKGRDKNNDPVAIKVLNKRQIDADKFLFQCLQQEIYFMMKFKSDNIVKLIDYHETQTSYYIILEFCDGGNIQDLIKRKRFLKENEALHIMTQIMNAFKLLHENKIIHRDLKPENIMVNKGVCKLTDFGFSKYIEDYDNATMTTCVGTPIYMSPQLLMKKPYSTKCDVWSIGVIFYQMLMGHPPWEGRSHQELEQKIKYQKVQFPYHAQISEQSKNFIRDCLQIDERRRITWEKVFQCPIFLIQVYQQPVVKQRSQSENRQNINSQDKLKKLRSIFLDNLTEQINNNLNNIGDILQDLNLQPSKQLTQYEFYVLAKRLIPSFNQQDTQSLFNSLNTKNLNYINVENIAYQIEGYKNILKQDRQIEKSANNILQALIKTCKEMKIDAKLLFKISLDIEMESIITDYLLESVFKQLQLDINQEQISKILSFISSYRQNLKFESFLSWLSLNSLMNYLCENQQNSIQNKENIPIQQSLDTFEYDINQYKIQRALMFKQQQSYQ